MSEADLTIRDIFRRGMAVERAFTAMGAAALASAVRAEAAERGGEVITFLPADDTLGHEFLACAEVSAVLSATVVAVAGPALHSSRPRLQVVSRGAGPTLPDWFLVWTSPAGGAAFALHQVRTTAGIASYTGFITFDRGCLALLREAARELVTAWGAIDPGPIPHEIPARSLSESVNARLAWELQSLAASAEWRADRLQAAQLELAGAQGEVVERLVAVMLHRDPETGGHLRRIGWTAQAIAERMGCDIAYCLDLGFASMLHDIGKVAIPDAVLMEPGALDDEAWDVMRQHPLLGARILAGSASPLLRMAERIALAHHERWDGGGYPHGLAGEAIPIEAQVTAVADAFDAMTSRRRYKAPMAVDEALEELRRHAGTQFGPDVVEVFLDNAPELVAPGD